MNYKKILFALIIPIIGISTNSFARVPMSQTSIVTPQCFVRAANANKVSITVALALLKTEGGRPGMMKRNTNGSYDLGVMQVNDRTWIPKIARAYFNGDYNRAYATVRDNGCFNVLMGTQIFATYLSEANGDYFKAIGYYNSHTPKYMARYQKIVMQRYRDVYNVFKKHNFIK